MLLFVNPKTNVTAMLTRLPVQGLSFSVLSSLALLPPRAILNFNQENIVLRCGAKTGAGFLPGRARRILEPFPCPRFGGILTGTGPAPGSVPGHRTRPGQDEFREPSSSEPAESSRRPARALLLPLAVQPPPLLPPWGRGAALRALAPLPLSRERRARSRPRGGRHSDRGRPGEAYRRRAGRRTAASPSTASPPSPSLPPPRGTPGSLPQPIAARDREVRRELWSVSEREPERVTPLLFRAS